MLTLTAVKRELGILEKATSEDAELLRCIRHAAGLARSRTNRYLYCPCGTLSQSGETVTVSAPAHQIAAGETVRIVGTGTALDGARTVATVTENSFTVAFSTSVSDTKDTGTIHPVRKFTFAGNGRLSIWIPQHITPVREIETVEVWDRGQWTAIDLTFIRTLQEPDGRVIQLERLDGQAWPMAVETRPRQFGRMRPTEEHTVRVTVQQGLTVLPAEIEMALLSMVSELRERTGSPRDMASVSIGGTSRTPFTGNEKFEQRYSPDNVFLNWKAHS